MDQALITITSLPEIRENLTALKARWEAKAAEAAAMVCTDESVQSVKRLRAEMRREFEEADSQRKAVKARYMAPWEEVEETWRLCVAEPFQRADASYKGTIAEFEDGLKRQCRERLEKWFSELLTGYELDFLNFDQAMGIAGIKIGMADATAKTPKRIMDALWRTVEQIDRGREQISQMDEADRAEIMAEYKKSLDLGHAISCVQGRRRMIQAEREAQETRRKAQEQQRDAEPEAETALRPPVTETVRQETEPRFERFSFTVKNVSREQLIKIREFLKEEGIEYE